MTCAEPAKALSGWALASVVAAMKRTSRLALPNAWTSGWTPPGVAATRFWAPAVLASASIALSATAGSWSLKAR